MVALPQTTRFGSVKISLEAVKSLWRTLDKEVQEQRKIEQHNANINPDIEDEGIDRMFRVACVVNRSDGHRDIFYDPSELIKPPEDAFISTILLTNILSFQQETNVQPLHQFEVLLDFTQPRLLDSSTPLSDPTPNPSGLLIGGERVGWRAGIESAVKKYVKERNRLWSWFHGQFVYDLFLFLIGIPFALYVCWRLAPLIDRVFAGINTVVIGGAYIYVGFCAIWLYRLAFSYARWAWPKIELAEQSMPSKRHRVILIAAVAFVSTAVIANQLDLPFIGKIGGILFTR